MKTQSTYSLLVRSQENARSIFENAVYALLVISAAIGIAQFATQPVSMPSQAHVQTASAAMVAQAGEAAVAPRS